MGREFFLWDIEVSQNPVSHSEIALRIHWLAMCVALLLGCTKAEDSRQNGNKPNMTSTETSPDAAVPEIVRADAFILPTDAQDPYALIKEKDPSETVPLLIEALANDHFAVRYHAAEAAGQLGPSAVDAVPALIETLRTGNDHLWLSSANALRQIGVAAIPSLIDALGNENSQVRSRAAFAITHFGSDGKQAVPRLIECQKIEDAEELTSFVSALGAIGPAAKAAVSALIPLLAHEHLVVRARAAISLGRIKSLPETVIPALTERLNDSSDIVRYMAASALGEFGSLAVSAVPKLKDALEDESVMVRLDAAAALCRIDVERSEKPLAILIDALLDEDATTRRLAAHKLGIVGPTADRSLDALEQATEDPDKLLRDAAIKAIERIRVTSNFDTTTGAANND